MGRQEPAPRPRAKGAAKKGSARTPPKGGGSRSRGKKGGGGRIAALFALVAVIGVGVFAHRLLSNRIVPPVPSSSPREIVGERRSPPTDVETPRSGGPSGEPRSVSPKVVDSPPEPASSAAVAPARSSEPERPSAVRLPAEPTPIPIPEPAAVPIPAPTVAQKAPPVPRTGAPVVAIILDDVGHDVLFVREAVRRLPRQVVFAVIPHRKDSRECAGEAGAAGFDVICHLPMQPLDGRREEEDSGVIRVGMDEAAISRTVVADVESVPGAIGVNNHQGSRATENAPLMESALRVLRARGLFFVDSRTSPRSIAETVARNLGMPTTGRDLFLDEDQDPRAIERQVDALAALAKKRGKALGICHARTSTLDALETAIGRFEKQGVRLVTIREYLGLTQPGV